MVAAALAALCQWPVTVYTSNMHYLTLVLTLVALFQRALSFAETSPVVAWSSHRYSNPYESITPSQVSLTFPFVHHRADLYYIRCGALDRLRPGSVSTSSTPFLNDVSTKLLSNTDVCEFDAVIIVDHPGVSPKHVFPSLISLGRPESQPT